MTLNLPLWAMILVYLALQTMYVILNTLKSIWQIKAGKQLASISSGICYAVYVYVLVFTTLDFGGISYFGGLCIKAILTFITNYIGVFVSMKLLEKLKKDKMWEITATVTGTEMSCVLEYHNLSYNVIPTNRPHEYVYHIYSKSQKDSAIIKNVLDAHSAKYIVHEETVRL